VSFCKQFCPLLFINRHSLQAILTFFVPFDILALCGWRGPSVTASHRAWRDGRVDDGDGLENRCGRKVTGGSNPSPSAVTLGRCQRGRLGPPAKRLRGQKAPSRVRIPASPLSPSARACSSMDRAPLYESEGCGFESRQARQIRPGNRVFACKCARPSLPAKTRFLSVGAFKCPMRSEMSSCKAPFLRMRGLFLF
jgi:hypothetical protein